ncbi:Hsp20/alpha crystallin family protein [Corynebacterium glyciniphilum]|uniref:Hsp20/alpha crystallin family protein n=1 Tax=Corynebacterium glyciniphilum TaxID=1404244 RepID=UPI002654B9BF|nr:Hsp20/alpha crystallin family protein [Corynebacterium glyciniphilum]MDN6706041.1 Hsp20/alpha crystallin family protein [Corynebacterium glyciniphilum]
MATFRFDPFAQLDSVAREIFGESGALGNASRNQAPRFMPMDLVRKGDDYILTTDLPGVDADSIDVDIDNGVLTISAQRTTGPTQSADTEAPQDTEDTAATHKWIANERFTGTYRRQVTVSDSVDTERVTADYTDGVLTVTLPVAERSKSRKITVGRSGDDTPKEIDA